MDFAPQSAKIDSYLEATNNATGATAASVNFTVPAGTIFRGVLNTLARGDKASSQSVANFLKLSRGGTNLFWTGRTEMFSITGHGEVGITQQVELQPGNYTLASSGNGFDSSQESYVFVLGVCYSLK